MDFYYYSVRYYNKSCLSNSFRVLSMHLNFSSITYYEKIQEINNKLTWDNQVAAEQEENFNLSYATSKVGENKMANEIMDHNLNNREEQSNIKTTTLNNMFGLQDEGMAINSTNTCTIQGLEIFSILYYNY